MPLSRTFRVLVIEDSAFSRKLLEHALRDEPYQIDFAESGRQAMQALSEHGADLVITDWMLPDVSGPELCKKIRTEHSGSYIYILLLTSNVDKEHMIEGLQSGADDYVGKPFHAGELLARLAVGRRIAEMHRVIEEKNRLLEHAARTDFLTELPNRRAVEEYGRKQLKGALRHKFPLWVVLADLNKFKRINDTYGHAAGDEVLKRFASVLKRNSRESDICGRLGGDEFVAIVAHGQESDILKFCERLRSEFARERFEFEGQKVEISVALGIGGFAEGETADLEQLMSRADAAVYAAKDDGRIRVFAEAVEARTN